MLYLLHIHIENDSKATSHNCAPLPCFADYSDLCEQHSGFAETADIYQSDDYGTIINADSFDTIADAIRECQASSEYAAICCIHRNTDGLLTVFVLSNRSAGAYTKSTVAFTDTPNYPSNLILAFDNGPPYRHDIRTYRLY